MKVEANFVVQELEKKLREMGLLGYVTATPVLNVHVYVKGGLSGEMIREISEKESHLVDVVKVPLNIGIVSESDSYF